ncbi:hypothetical protein [Sandaracinobacteroides saxicola]|uniref:Flippase-like domain-containing protein n=1 Tax=Sandaracinobacteroides saxicola TaxID=2759707 RepID=A0A7G5IGP9_9SPHN|nr:hypothetical protein [Sandaracinobacteroides saxicola]QMW22541.1 hypothetical protein H3309_14635 [Sandaracinobacteroides saxicola]
MTLATAPLALDADDNRTPNWQRLLGFALSAGVIGFLFYSVGQLGWAAIVAVLPANPLFYLLLAAAYFTLPFSELLIFRRLWNIGWPAFGVFVKKRVLNDAVFGYSGEAWLFVWARNRARLRESALAGVKDVAIMSALAGNLATLLLVLAALPFAHSALFQAAISGDTMRAIALGTALVMAVSVALVLFRKRVLSLSPADNRFAFLVACLRLGAAGALVLVAWTMALPAVSVGVWLLLGAMRLIISRLPLVPNKDLLFTGLAVALAGAAQPQVAALLAATAAMTFVFHALGYALVQGAELLRKAPA